MCIYMYMHMYMCTDMLCMHLPLDSHRALEDAVHAENGRPARDIAEI